MDKTYGTKKFEADKITLLGLFIAGVLLAHLITSSRYTQPAKAGREIIAEIKQKGISSFLDELGRQSFFLINSNVTGRTIGFSMDVCTDLATEAKLNIQSAGCLYTRGRYSQQRVMFFQSNNSFDEFSWKTEAAQLGRNSGTEILLDQDGTLTVTQLGQNRKQQRYRPTSASIPNILLELVFSRMLQTNRTKIIIDTISADGRSVEVAISRIRPSQIEAEHKLKVHFLDERGTTQKVYLDSQGRILKIQQNGAYRFERTTAENIIRQFPEWADYILQKNKILEPGKPRH